ncbi:MAG: GTP 3',8-cyclase MoaA [Candidatus Zixiibacteriota bacterium]|nr:MAG: GTP 3',8-cyclase MoaA [candidate division Zixibacteria bacterium]
MILKDIYGRSISYLRVSLTERCNLDCGYCYGGSRNGDDPKRRLSDNTLLKLIKAFSLLGIDKIRYTGGEPLLREKLEDIIKETSKIESIKIIGLTTNGTLLGPRLDAFVRAGLNRLNISLDSLDRATYKKITGKDRLADVLEAIDLAERSQAFGHVKINVVVMRGINDHEIPLFAKWALPRNIDLRFVEFMPSNSPGWGEELFVGEDEIRQKMDLELEPLLINNLNAGPAKIYKHGDYPGRIGFVSAISRSFCARCNRLRLTSRGDLLGCLYDGSSIELGPIVKETGSIDELARMIEYSFREKLYRKSPDINIINGFKPSMREIGG